MTLLHPKINSEYLPETYRLREFIEPKNIAKTDRILKSVERALAGQGFFAGRRLSDSIFKIYQSYGSVLLYHAVGMRLYRHLMATGEIDVPWWDAFVPVIHRRMMAGILWGGVKPEDRTPIRELLERAEKATTTEEAAEILRSIAPQNNLAEEQHTSVGT